MPAIICVGCGRAGWFRATKGARLADRTCPVCGSDFTLKNKSTKPRPTGPMHSCAVCGFRSYRMRTLAIAATFRPAHRHGKHRSVVIEQLEGGTPRRLDAGEQVCSLHQPIELTELQRRHAKEVDALMSNDLRREADFPGGEYEALVARHRRETPAFFVTPAQEPQEVAS